jgi:hypothetical protein
VLALGVGCSTADPAPSPGAGPSTSVQPSTTGPTDRGPTGSLITAFRGEPPASVRPNRSGSAPPDLVLATWSSDGTRLYVTHWGSGACPSTDLATVVVTGDQELTITTDFDVITSSQQAAGQTVGASCTADLVPTTWVLDVPSVIDRGQRAEVKGSFGFAAVEPITGTTSAEPARPGTGTPAPAST